MVVSQGRTGVRTSGEPAIPAVLAMVGAADLALLPTRPFTLIAVQTPADAIAAMARLHPAVVIVDWDAPSFDAATICRAARPRASVLVITASPTHAPAALRAGCRTLLLKPFQPTLAASRIGRLLREVYAPADREEQAPSPALACARCDAPDAVHVDFASHRQAWFACLACDHVWLTHMPH